MLHPFRPIRIHVPFLIWMSDNYRRIIRIFLKYRDKPTEKYFISASFFQTMLELSGIDTPNAETIHCP